MMSFFLKLNRIKILGLFLSLFIGVIGLQMIRIQVSTHAETLDSWASSYGTEVRTIQSERGYIYDRWGHLLAGNKEVYELGVELQYVRNPVAIATAMASIFGSDYNTVLASVSTPYDSTGSVYVTLQDFIPVDQIDKLDALKQQYEDANPYGENPELPSLRGLVWTPLKAPWLLIFLAFILIMIVIKARVTSVSKKNTIISSLVSSKKWSFRWTPTRWKKSQSPRQEQVSFSPLTVKFSVRSKRF